ncbi:MAG: hypothetical protein KAG64_09100 [Bacteroidales bacterium]|nr:hypothetical protein [Bacteroidales bacterium]
MKLSEVPKDDANVLEGKTSFIQYAVDNNGNYVQEKSPGFHPQNIALENAWEDVNEQISEALELVIQNKKSPIYYFMHREIMDTKLLAEYIDLWAWKVKRHLKPSVFKTLNQEQLEKYAKVFGLNEVNDLVNFDPKKWM